MLKLPAKRRKTQLAGRSGDLRSGEFPEGEVNEGVHFWTQLHSPEIGICWLQTLPSPNVAACSTRWRLSACDSSGTVAFKRPELLRKVFLWTVVESVICPNVGDGTLST